MVVVLNTLAALKGEVTGKTAISMIHFLLYCAMYPEIMI